MLLLSILHSIQLQVALGVIILISDAQHALLDLSDDVTFPDHVGIMRYIRSHSAVKHHEFIFDVFLFYLRFYFARVLIVNNKTFVSPILSSIFLKVNVAILHDVKLLHFILVDVILSFLIFDEIGTFEKVVLYPVLKYVESEWDDDHDPDELYEGVAVED